MPSTSKPPTSSPPSPTAPNHLLQHYCTTKPPTPSSMPSQLPPPHTPMLPRPPPVPPPRPHPPPARPHPSSPPSQALSAPCSMASPRLLRHPRAGRGRARDGLLRLCPVQLRCLFKFAYVHVDVCAYVELSRVEVLTFPSPSPSRSPLSALRSSTNRPSLTPMNKEAALLALAPLVKDTPDLAGILERPLPAVQSTSTSTRGMGPWDDTHTKHPYAQGGPRGHTAQGGAGAHEGARGGGTGRGVFVV